MYIVNHIHVQQAPNLTKPNRSHPHIKTCLSFDRPCTICNFLLKKFNYLLIIMFHKTSPYFHKPTNNKTIGGLTPSSFLTPRCQVPTHKSTNYLYYTVSVQKKVNKFCKMAYVRNMMGIGKKRKEKKFLSQERKQPDPLISAC